MFGIHEQKKRIQKEKEKEEERNRNKELSNDNIKNNF